MKQGETVGSYRIVRRIGVGGMGEVYEVEHLALGTRYALKTFVLENGDAAFLRERFLAEGRALARIEHPNVARVFDLGVMPDGTAYFVMDLVLDVNGEPRTLADISPDEFTDADRLRWLESIASALDCIHAEGIVHRDVKASNILLNATESRRPSSQVMKNRRVGSLWELADISLRKSGRAERRARHPMSIRSPSFSSGS